MNAEFRIMNFLKQEPRRFDIRTSITQLPASYFKLVFKLQLFRTSLFENLIAIRDALSEPFLLFFG